MIVLGIDPGLRTGLAVVDRDRMKVVQIMTVGWPEAESRSLLLARSHLVDEIVVEVPSGHLGKNRKARLGPRGVEAASQALGKSIQKAQDLARFLRNEGFRVRERNPLRRGTKWSEPVFRSYFGWEGGRTSDHARDAAVLAALG